MGQKCLPRLKIPYRAFRGKGKEALILIKRSDLIDLAKKAAEKWENPLTALLYKKPEDCLGYTSRFLLAAGIVAQRLSIGVFMWAPIGENNFLYGGEVADVLLPCLRSVPSPPFAHLLGALDWRVGAGRGFDPESESLIHQLHCILGPKDPVVMRLCVRRSVIPVGKKKNRDSAG